MPGERTVILAGVADARFEAVSDGVRVTWVLRTRAVPAASETVSTWFPAENASAGA